MDTLRAMRVFVRLVEQKSLAKAAESLEMEKGTASKLLQQLESHLRIPLVERHARRLVITDEGLGYYQDARQILLEIDGAEARARGDNSQARGRLRVEMPAALGQGVLGPLIPEFLAANPGLNLEVLISDRVLNVVEHGIDVALRVGSPPELDSAARLLGNYTSIVCAAPCYRSPRGMTAAQAGAALLSRPEDLADEHCLIGLHPSDGWHHRWELTQTASGRQAAVDVSGPLSLSNQPMLLGMALRGVGIAYVPEPLVAQHLADGALIRLLPDWEKPGAPLYAIYSPIRPLPQRIAAFLDWMSEWAREAESKGIGGQLGQLEHVAAAATAAMCPVTSAILARRGEVTEPAGTGTQVAEVSPPGVAATPSSARAAAPAPTRVAAARKAAAAPEAAPVTRQRRARSA